MVGSVKGGYEWSKVDRMEFNFRMEFTFSDFFLNDSYLQTFGGLAY